MKTPIAGPADRRAAARWRVLVLAAGALCSCAATLFAQVEGKYLYTLSDFSGRLPYPWVRVAVDQQRNETYVLFQNLVRVFNASGMEIFSFGDDLDLGQIVDAAVDDRGDIILLSHRDSRPLVTRCNFRGVPVGPMAITNLPAGLVFDANRMVYRDGSFYFARLGAGSVIITDGNGQFREHIDLMPLVYDGEKEKTGAELAGFTVDRDGNILFTVPVFFKAYKLSRERTLTAFGRPGSVPGRFGVVSGIAADSRGRLLVADKLRCVIMVFDGEYNFVTEFGYRGTRPENLLVPDDLAVDGQDRLYVSQGGRRGVSVFALDAP